MSSPYPNRVTPLSSKDWASTLVNTHHVGPRGFFPDRSCRTDAVRFRYTGPVQPGTAQDRMNQISNQNPVRWVWSGILTGLTGTPVRFDRFPVV
jgi:hypothetical protein